MLANKGLNIHEHLSVMLDYPKFIGSKWMENWISQERFKLFNSLHAGKFLPSADYFQNYFFKKFFQENQQSVKQFESRSGPTICRSCSGFKLFAKFRSRRHWQAKFYRIPKPRMNN